MFLKYISILIFCISFSNGADILAIIPFPSYSHQIAYTHIWKELSLRGHKVTLLTTDPLKDHKLKNLTEIDLKWSYEYFKDISKVAEKSMTMWNFYDIVLEKTLKVSNAQLSSPLVQNLIHNKTNFDVVLVEFVFLEYLAFAEIYKCPKIIISSLEVNAYYYETFGNPTHPVLYPDFAASFYGSFNFMERVETTLFDWYLSLFYDYKWNPARQKLVDKYFNTKLTVKELISDADMMFLNTNPIIQSPRALGPTTINVGGFRQTLSKTPLPKDIEEFLDSAEEGFIYFSLGSNVKSKELSEETLNNIIETLTEVPYKVLWKFEDDTLPGKPDNIKLVKWALQEKVLSHPNIKLFITQGGIQSMEEAIYGTVPFVVIPFFADQEQNAKLMEGRGIAKIVGRRPYLKKGDLKNAISEVINNPRYKDSVKKMKQLILDTPMTGLEKAVWWTEYVIRNKGATHLRNPAADLPTYQYYLLDVISFVILVVVLVLLVIFVVINKLYKLLLYMLVDKKLMKCKKLQ